MHLLKSSHAIITSFKNVIQIKAQTFQNYYISCLLNFFFKISIRLKNKSHLKNKTKLIFIIKLDLR